MSMPRTLPKERLICGCPCYDNKPIIIANANRFSISSDRIAAQEAGVKIFFDGDSIFHGNLQFKYVNSERQLQLYRKVNGRSGAPMLRSILLLW